MAIFESILVVGLSCYITFRYNPVNNSVGEQVQTFSAVACAIVYIAIPVFGFFRLYCYFGQVHENHVKRSIGFLYERLAV